MSQTPLPPGTEAANARLDRLERESFRRKWDSTVLTAGQRTPRNAAIGSTPDSPPMLDETFVDLLTERLNRNDAKCSRLERQLVRVEKSQRIWRRVSCILIFVTVMAVAATIALPRLRVAGQNATRLVGSTP